jgi:hypothetical protein
MSDFYQILKREVESAESQNITTKSSDDFSVKKMPVDNFKLKKNPTFKKRSSVSARLVNNKAKKASKKSVNLKQKADTSFLSFEPSNPIWLTMAETAKLGGVQKRTVKRALRSSHLKYRIVESRYQVDLRSALLYFRSKKKLWNKLKESGIGQYVEKWRT